MPRFLILADGDFGPMTSKTANSVIRYRPDQVVAVLDRQQAGKTVQEVLGFGGSTPVVGSMAGTRVHLDMVPMTVTTWGEWVREHPGTTVTKLDPSFGARWGYDYRPGAADRRREGVSFPVWLKSGVLPAKEEVYGLRLGARAKAWPIERVVRERLDDREHGFADRPGHLDAPRVARPGGGLDEEGVPTRPVVDPDREVEPSGVGRAQDLACRLDRRHVSASFPVPVTPQAGRPSRRLHPPEATQGRVRRQAGPTARSVRPGQRAAAG